MYCLPFKVLYCPVLPRMKRQDNAGEGLWGAHGATFPYSNLRSLHHYHDFHVLILMQEGKVVGEAAK